MSTEIELPLPPQKEQLVEMEAYARFMQHLRRVPHNRMEIKILSAIQFTADMMDYTDAQIAKMMVDCGLRVGRAGLQMDYLEFADAALMRSGWDVGGPSAPLVALKDYWDETGEDKFAAFRRDYTILREPMMGAV